MLSWIRTIADRLRRRHNEKVTEIIRWSIGEWQGRLDGMIEHRRKMLEQNLGHAHWERWMMGNLINVDCRNRQ
jgi:hypothetical protein